MLGLVLRAYRPLSTVYVDIEHVGDVHVHALPGTRPYREALHDNEIILEQILTRDVGIVEVPFGDGGVLCGSLRHRLHRDPHELDRRAAGIHVPAVGGRAGTLPSDASIAPPNRAAVRLRGKNAAADEHEQLITPRGVPPGPLTRGNHEFLDADALVIEHDRAEQVRIG